MQAARVTLFWTSSIGNKDQATRYLLRADEVLRNYAMYLDCMPGYYPTSQFSLEWSDTIDVDYDPQSPGLSRTKGHAALLKLRGLGDAAYKDTKPRLPVFFAKLSGASGYTATETGWWPWCVVDVSRTGDSPETMIHEMGHAALLKHYNKYDMNSRNIMSWGKNKSEFLPTQISKIWNSYYVTGNSPEAGWQNFDFE
jgi:hypothetical protein